MDLKNALVDLGLSKNEAAIYLLLLERGTCQAGPLVKLTRLHRMLVYTALERLTDGGLVTVVKKKNIQFFQAVDPTHLIERTKRSQTLAETILPELQQLQSKKGEAITVKTLFGREGLMTNLEETITSAGQHSSREICIMGGAGGVGNNPISHTADRYPEYVELSKRYRIKKRLLISPEYEDIFKEQFLPYSNNELRVLPAGFSTPMFTRITKDVVSIEIYQPQITVIQIRSAIVAQNYLDSFEALWKVGEQVKVKKQTTHPR